MYFKTAHECTLDQCPVQSNTCNSLFMRRSVAERFIIPCLVFVSVSVFVSGFSFQVFHHHDRRHEDFILASNTCESLMQAVFCKFLDYVEEINIAILFESSTKSTMTAAITNSKGDNPSNSHSVYSRDERLESVARCTYTWQSGHGRWYRK